MNLALFKVSNRANLVVLVIIAALMFMYLSIIITMFDPDSVEELQAMIDMLPPQVASMMGFHEIATSLTDFLGSFYYAFIAILFPMIFTIIVVNRLVVGHVDRGSMAYLLATPHSRQKIVATQAAYMLFSLTILFAFLTLVGIGMSEAMFAGELETGRFVLLNLVTLLVFFALSGICFFFSCLFDEAKHSLALGGGMAILFFMFNMLANLNDQFSWLGYLSLFSLKDPARVLAGDSFAVLAAIAAAVIALAAYGAGIWVFNRRSLPL